MPPSQTDKETFYDRVAMVVLRAAVLRAMLQRHVPRRRKPRRLAQPAAVLLAPLVGHMSHPRSVGVAGLLLHCEGALTDEKGTRLVQGRTQAHKLTGKMPGS